MDGWNTIVSFWGPACFQGRTVLLVTTWEKTWGIWVDQRTPRPIFAIFVGRELGLELRFWVEIFFSEMSHPTLKLTPYCGKIGGKFLFVTLSPIIIELENYPNGGTDPFSTSKILGGRVKGISRLVSISYCHVILCACFVFTSYCWWKKSCTTLDVKNLVNTGKNYLSTGAGFLPSTVFHRLSCHTICLIS